MRLMRSFRLVLISLLLLTSYSKNQPIIFQGYIEG